MSDTEPYRMEEGSILRKYPSVRLRKTEQRKNGGCSRASSNALLVGLGLRVIRNSCLILVAYGLNGCLQSRDAR